MGIHRGYDRGKDIGDSGVPSKGVNLYGLLFCASWVLLRAGFLYLLSGRVEHKVRILKTK